MIPKERSKAMNEERRNRLIKISIKLSDLMDDLEEMIEEEEYEAAILEKMNDLDHEDQSK